jgi:type VII secretion effector (TIGR04197 family)
VSMAKVVEVKHARAEYRCEKDQTVIAKGDPYRWYTVGFRSRFRHIRCMKGSCTPKPSERESSQLSEVYAAQESAEDAFNDMSTAIETIDGAKELVEDVKSTLQEAADSIREVADGYREADENFGGGGQTEMGEWADTLEEGIDSLESWEPDTDADDIDGCGEHEDEEHPLSNGLDPDCEDCQSGIGEWASETIESARDLVSGMETP